MGPAAAGAVTPLMGRADPAAVTALLGPADHGTMVSLMGPADPGTAAPLMLSTPVTPRPDRRHGRLAQAGRPGSEQITGPGGRR
jgi:hypothetical protein